MADRDIWYDTYLFLEKHKIILSLIFLFKIISKQESIPVGYVSATYLTMSSIP